VPTQYVLLIIGIFVLLFYGVLVMQRQWLLNAREFLVEVKGELRKVTWPNKKEVKSTTLIVIVTVIFFGAYLSAIDLVVGRARTALYGVLGIGQ